MNARETNPITKLISSYMEIPSERLRKQDIRVTKNDLNSKALNTELTLPIHANALSIKEAAREAKGREERVNVEVVKEGMEREFVRVRGRSVIDEMI